MRKPDRPAVPRLRVYEVLFYDGTLVTMEAEHRAEARYRALRELWRGPYRIGEVKSARLCKEPA